MSDVKLPPGFQFADESEVSDLKKILLFGATGTGKTTIGCTAPNPMFALTESKSLRRIKAMQKTLGIKIPYLMIDAPSALKRFIKLMHKAPGDNPFTVVVDSISDYYEVIKKDMLEGRKSIVPAKNDWQIIQAEIERVLRDLSNLPHHVIVLASQKEYNVKEDGETIRRVVPQFSGDAMPLYIGKLFQAVGLCFRRKTMGESQFLVAFEADDNVITKRDDGLRPVEVPNVGLWFEAIDAAYEAGNHSYTSDYQLTEETVPTANEVGKVPQKKA